MLITIANITQGKNLSGQSTEITGILDSNGFLLLDSNNFTIIDITQ